MRLLVSLKATRDQGYLMEYHHHLQGLIYSLLLGTRYHGLHDKEGYKFFSFSNIFPAYDMRKGEDRSLIIASPDDGFIDALFTRLLDICRQGMSLRVGSMEFRIAGIKRFQPRLDPRGFKLITGTPIVVRIPFRSFERYGLKPRKPYEYLYWRKEHPIEAFVNQLEDNLAKKYLEYYGKEPIRERLFNKLRFKKQVSTKVWIHGSQHVVIGTIWEFTIEGASPQAIDALSFGLEAGLGERNSLGFGFMNLVRERRETA